MDRHTLYAVNVDTVGAGDIFIDQIADFRLDPRINKLLEGGDGGVYNTHVSVLSQDPRIIFTTTKLASALAKCGLTGLAITADVDEPGAEFWFQKLVEGGTRATGASHIKLTVAEGLLLPRTINAPHNGRATIGYECIATYDGTNDPIVVAGSQELSGTPSVSELFTAGKAMINGAQLEGVQNIVIDIGIQELVEGADGLVWPTYAGILRIQPVIRITTADAGALSTFGLTGAAQGATDSIVYLRKLAEGGTRVADATEEHISFTIDEGHISVSDVSGPHGQRLGSMVEISPTYDGTNAPLVINTATAIA